MTTYTTNLNLTKASLGTQRWDTILNSNFDLIDAAVGSNVSSIADFPEIYRYADTFNSTTGVAIALPKSVDSVNEYGVKVQTTARTGAVGDIWVAKTTSQITVYCSEANTTDSFEVLIFYIGDVSSYGGSIYRRWYVSPDAAITDHTDNTDEGSLAWIISELSGAPALIEFPGNTTYVFDDDYEIPDNVQLRLQPGAVLSVNSTYTLTINKPEDIVAVGELQQIFSGAGSIAFNEAGTIYPGWWGSPANGTDDDEVYIQAANNAAAVDSTIDFGHWDWRVSRNTGTNDRWGINVIKNGIFWKGHGATIRRYNTDISTYALAYPILLVGTPDSNVASATEDFRIEGITFIGEDTRHASAGAALHDGRYAIEFKNTTGSIIDKNCKFTLVDSSAIYFQGPDEYDYANSAYYNTTKNYNAKILNSQFIAESHSTASRALIHAIAGRGIDRLLIDKNYSEWCDDFVAISTSYDELDDVETDTYSGETGSVMRSGKKITITKNDIYNSSEHALYMECNEVKIKGNNIWTDDETTCASSAIKIRCRGFLVTGNMVNGYTIPVSISEPSAFGLVNKNEFYTAGDSEGGMVYINTESLSTFIDARDWMAGNYLPMQNIQVKNNSITMPEGSQTYGYAFRIYTASSDANFPEGQLQNVQISENTVNNHRVGLYVAGAMHRNISFCNNHLFAKPFTSSGFSTGTTLNTYASIMIPDGAPGTVTLQNLIFNGNYVYGSSYVFATATGSGSNMYLPRSMQENNLYYIKYFKTADVRSPSAYAVFQNNTGNFFLDRTGWIGATALNNHLHDGSTDNTARKYTIEYSGGNVIFITDDSATSLTLNN